MGISAVYNGKEQAECICDGCGSRVLLNCRHGTRPTNPSKRQNSAIAGTANEIKNLGAITKQLTKRMWKVSKNNILCNECVLKTREEKMVRAKVEPIREPSRDQKREITLMLNDVYDIEKQCYKKSETDASVAEVLGTGILWGWVAKIREDMFGPDGNEDDQLTVGEAKLWIARADEQIAKFEKQINALQTTLNNIQATRKEVDGFLQTLERMAK